MRHTCTTLLLTLLLSSCATQPKQPDFRALAHAAVVLEMDIDYDDCHSLYIEAAEWLGVPYRAGGKDRRGTDCSGLVSAIYRKVYHKKLERNSDDQRIRDCSKVRKSSLNEGDLVFFHDGRSKRTASHVGIYLKDGKFIHASSRKGVMVSSLDEEYWERTWMQGGRVKGVKRKKNEQ